MCTLLFPFSFRNGCMLTLDDIRGLNIELSSKCGASCPFCSRNQKVRPYGAHLITLADFKKLPVAWLRNLHWITFSGNFGDMSTNCETVDIVSYLKSINPGVTIQGNSNGTLQCEDWWASLGNLLRDGTVVFSVDGLEDTHAIHRRGTDFHRIIRNMKAFTNAGGIAHWQFILFKHNEHQVDAAAELAEKAGCARFFVLTSRDYDETCQQPETVDVSVKRQVLHSYGDKAMDGREIAGCKPLHNGSIYIAADGTVYPCCLAHCMYITEHNAAFDYIVPLTRTYHGDINFKTNPLAEIIQGEYFNKIFKISKHNPYCIMKCNSYKKEIKKELVIRDIWL